MIELLKLCGYGEPEIKKELPRVEKALSRLGIGAGDIELGKQRLIKYYDMDLKGIRAAFRLCMREFVDSILVREEGKTMVLYGFMAPGYEIISAAVMSGSREVYSINQPWALYMIAGCIFDKIIPILEAAEKKWLKAGVAAHCGNVKTILGVFALDILSKPDLMMTSGSLCETAPKTFDLLHEYYDIPVHFYETCQDREIKEYSAASKRAIELEAKSLKKLFERIQEVVGYEITDKMLWEAIYARKNLNSAMSKMRNILLTSDPLPLSPTHETLWMCLNALSLRGAGLQDAADAVNLLCEELQERVNKGRGVVEKGSPRIIAMCPGQHTDPRLEFLVNELGIALVATDSIFSVPYTEKPQSPEMMLAATLQGSLFTCPSQRISLLAEGCKRLKIEGIFDRYHVGCRTSAGDALVIKDGLEKELGIPVLLLEWENFDPRYFNYEQYKKKLEAFKGMMLNKRGSTGTK
jgi:benzoyl-CoA reductase/2-hydroxyglutaryl-CoA dehydratase subunit BcrC/BadD/HgdB